jgi:adenosylcobinamide-GDP ribazoletransferase
VISSFLAAIAFYTRLPVPTAMALQFERVACLAPVVGLGIGTALAGFDWVLSSLGMPPLARSAAVVTVWVAITGGLHLDGAIDAADGLAVPDPSRRLAVMTESTVGAFGVMTAVMMMMLKTTALASLMESRHQLSLELGQLSLGLMLPLAAGWGRWSQQVAIACFPYLKPTGKGAFHKVALPSIWDTLPALLLLLGLSALPLGFSLGLSPEPTASLTQVLPQQVLPQQVLPQQVLLQTVQLAAGAGVAAGVAVWFGRQFGGHTGDTYGAVVEWTEALVLLLWTLGQP